MTRFSMKDTAIENALRANPDGHEIKFGVKLAGNGIVMKEIALLGIGKDTRSWSSESQAWRYAMSELLLVLHYELRLYYYYY